MGKTSLVNALLGTELLPVAVVPLTSIVTMLTYGTALLIEVFFLDGRKIEIVPERLAEFITEMGNLQNVKQVGVRKQDLLHVEQGGLSLR